MRYAYQVRMCYMRVFGTDPHSDMGPVKWDRHLRDHFRQGVLPMDAARGIHTIWTSHDN